MDAADMRHFLAQCFRLCPAEKVGMEDHRGDPEIFATVAGVDLTSTY